MIKIYTIVHNIFTEKFLSKINCRPVYNDVFYVDS